MTIIYILIVLLILIFIIMGNDDDDDIDGNATYRSRKWYDYSRDSFLGKLYQP